MNNREDVTLITILLQAIESFCFFGILDKSNHININQVENICLKTKTLHLVKFIFFIYYKDPKRLRAKVKLEEYVSEK